MPSELALDAELLGRLPLPLAQLYRRAHNAKTGLERHLSAYYLWEASLKLLGSVAIVAYAEQGVADPQLAERLQNLARPSLGHWWEFVRLLVPILADQNREGFSQVRDLLLGPSRDDLPRAAGLDAALRETLENKPGARATVRLTQLFDWLVQYRNREMGYGLAGQRSEDFYSRMSRALLSGVAEILSRLDVLAGGRLIYVAAIRQAAGNWLVERYELMGEAPRRLESVEVPRAEAARLPVAEQVYLERQATKHALHPLVIYDPEAEEMLFLNARRGKKRTEYVCYTSGRTAERTDLGGEQRELLARVLGMSVTEAELGNWAQASQADSPAVEESPAPTRRQLGEFELLSELGRGGMAVVYRAWQPSLGRQVALKLLYRTGDPKAEARFAREIHALGRVEHRNLVKIFSSGAEGEQWFYAMELLEGVTLDSVCERMHIDGAGASELDLAEWQDTLTRVCEEARRSEKPLTDLDPEAEPAPSRVVDRVSASDGPPPMAGLTYIRHIVQLMTGVASAAHALHENGVVHRDIKPGNIMVTPDGSQAVLMDLGLAQLADETEGRLTRTRQFVGTLRYASPQQVFAVGRLDRQSDVYSLGATLWELLTLRPLFGATDQTPTPMLMQRIVYEEPDRVRKYNRRVGRDLEAIVLKCLEKEPQRRYPTASDLARDLQRFLDAEPVRARPVASVERLWRWCRRNPAWAALVGMTGYSLLLTAAMVVERVRELVVWVSAGVLVCACLATVVFFWLRSLSSRARAKVHSAATPVEQAREPFALDESSKRSKGPGSRLEAAQPAAEPVKQQEREFAVASAPQGQLETKNADGDGNSTVADDAAFSSHVVVTRYPMPIAMAYRRFLNQPDSTNRLWHLFGVVEALLRYLTILALSDLLQCLANSLEPGESVEAPGDDQPRQPPKLPDHEAFDLLRWPPKKNMTLGKWLETLRETARCLGGQDRRFIRELPSICHPDQELLNQLLNLLVKARNDCFHHEGGLIIKEPEVRLRIQQLRPMLDKAIHMTGFVCRYPLGFAKEGLPEPDAPGHPTWFHSCMGVLLADTAEACAIKTPIRLRANLPFVVAPDSSRLMYLWPLLLERSLDTGRHMLYGFVKIPEKRRAFLTGVQYAALEFQDPLIEDWHQEYEDSHAWLFEEIRRLPPTPVWPPHLPRIARELQQSRGGNLENRILGKYRLEKKWAQGGFGEIYLAEAAPGEEGPGRYVAVKIISSPDISRYYARFKLEFEKLQLAKHPGIVKCYQFSTSTIGNRQYPWYSMEFAAGGDLTKRIMERKQRTPEGSLPWEVPSLRAEIVQEFRAVAEATGHLHTLGIVHRDIKPGNVLVMENGELRLSDFGLVKVLMPDKTQPLIWSSHGARMGTYLYMAPEQEQGREVDKQADVYSLGILLAELASGEQPETNTHVNGGSTIKRTPTLPGGRSSIAQGLERFLRRCTDIEPERRFRDAPEVLEEFLKLPDVQEVVLEAGTEPAVQE